MRKGLLGTLLLPLGVLAMVACGYGAPKPVAVPTPVPSKPGEIVVSATYPRFQPSTLSAAKGQAMTLKVTATDTNHTFTIDELGITMAVGKGQTSTREIRVEKAGSFTFYCTVPGHRGAGMQGTLKVTE